MSTTSKPNESQGSLLRPELVMIWISNPSTQPFLSLVLILPRRAGEIQRLPPLPLCQRNPQVHTRVLLLLSAHASDIPQTVTPLCIHNSNVVTYW